MNMIHSQDIIHCSEKSSRLNKRILIITPFVPSNKGAGQNYTLRMIEDLSEEYLVDLIYFKKADEDAYEVKSGNVRILGIIRDSTPRRLVNCLKVLFLHPIFSCRFHFRTVFKLFRIRKQYDLIYFDFAQILVYSLFIPHKRKILMLHDVVWQLYSRRKTFLGLIHKYLSFFSEKFIFTFSKSTILCFSRKDQKLIRDLYRRNSIVVDFYIDEKIRFLSRSDDAELTNKQFCFFGAWERPENTEGLEWFLENVINRIKKDVKFEVIGSGISEALESRLREFHNVTIRGFLDNPYESISRSSALVAPLFQGAGIKVKVIESLACGTPVIGTEIAFEGIDFVEGRYMFKCESPEDFADAIAYFAEAPAGSKAVLRKLVDTAYPRQTFKGLINELQ